MTIKKIAAACWVKPEYFLIDTRKEMEEEAAQEIVNQVLG